MDSLFDLPLLIAGAAIIGAMCLYGVLGLLVVRRYLLPRLRIQEGDSDFSSAMLQAVMVFYGLAVALIAVNVWQNYSDAAKVTSQEATAAAALYRDVSGYPEPARADLQKRLRDYVDQIIHEAWPIMQRGGSPTAGVEMMNHFQASLMSVEPVTEGEKLLHAEALGAYNQLIQARRLRLEAVGTRLPNVLWIVIVGGALIGLSSSFLFRIDDHWVHGIHVVLLAAFIGMMIFLVFAFDRPFRGELGLRPDAYLLVYEHLMKP